MNDKELMRRLGEFIDIVNKHGPRSEAAKSFIKRYDDKELSGLAAVVIMLKENKDLMK